MTPSPARANSSPSLRTDRSLLIVFIPCFVVLFSVALLGQLAGLHWKGWLPGAENTGNVFSGTRAAVYTLLSHIS